MSQITSLISGKPTSLVPLDISQLRNMINEIDNSLYRNKLMYLHYIEAVRKKTILPDNIFYKVQSLCCEINKGHSLLIQYIEKLKKVFPSDTIIYKNQDDALKEAKDNQSSWKNALITVFKFNESNKNNLKLDRLQFASIGGMSYRKRKSKRRKSKRRKSKRFINY